ncbi:MAG: OmpA family protein [Brumimicrobium sp.]
MIKNKSCQIILALFCFYTLFSHVISQTNNLIPNSSFESYKTLPDDVSQARECVVFWEIPNKAGSGEYYHSRCPTKKAGTKKNYFSKQNPHSGEAYVGICVTKKFREYLQIKLNSALMKGEKYTIKLFVSHGDKLWLSTIDELNILFSENSFTIPKNENLLTTPEIKFTGDFNNKKDWVELSTIYTANGTEKFMTFGSFMYKNKGEKHGEIKGPFKYAHYYIDDVSIKWIETKVPIVQDSIIEKEIPVDSIQELTLGEVYVLNNLQFESGKSILLPNNYPELDNLISYLEEHPKIKLLVTGHTDNVGSTADNKKLSLDRANAIKEYLITRGIDKDMVLIEGKGDELPIDSNETEEGRKNNRRVEISIIQ